MEQSFYKSLLEKAELISREYDEKVRNERIDFNIFRILQLSSNEVRTHSAFLAELFDKNGSHNLGNLFLRRLLEIINHIEYFDLENYDVIVEKYIGIIGSNYDNGGRIDILLTDSVGNQIIIENKIFAGDQPKQLKRYFNYNPNALIVYLTLDGIAPTKESLDGIDVKSIKCISYKEDIVQLLDSYVNQENCIQEVSSVLKQYSNLLKHLTNTTLNNKMQNKIIEMLLSSEGSFKAAKDITVAYNHLLWKIKSEFYDKVLQVNKILYSQLSKGNYTFDFKQGEDSDGFFVGVSVSSNGVNGINGNELLNNISKQVKSEFNNSNSNNFYLGWITPLGPGFKFDHLKDEIKFKLTSDKEYQEKELMRINTLTKAYFERIKQLINQSDL